MINRIILILCLSSCVNAFAFTNDHSEDLSLGSSIRSQSTKEMNAISIDKRIQFDKVLSYALSNSPKIHKYQRAVEIARQEWSQARSALLPRLDLTSTTQRITQYGDLPGLESLLLSGRNEIYQASSSLRLGLNLYNGGADMAGLSLANEKVKEADLQLQMQRADMALSVLDHVHEIRRAAFDWYSAQLQYDLDKQQLENAETRLKLGRMSALEHAEVQYDYKSSELALMSSSRAYRQSLRALISLIGGGENASDWFTNSSQQPDYQESLLKSELKSLSWVSQTHLSASRIRQAETDIQRARSGYLPKIDLFASINYAAVSESGYREAFDDQGKDNRLVGLTFTWNLFNGLNTTAEVEAATQRAFSAEDDEKLTRENLRNTVMELERQLANSVEARTIEAQHLELLTMKLTIGKEKLALGRIDDLSVKSIETEWQVQQLELEKSTEQVSYYQAKLFLQQGVK